MDTATAEGHPISQTTPRPIRVFLSYSRNDTSKVEALSELLKANNVDVLLDVREILPLEEWRHRLEQMIIAADAMIFCLSPSSARSDACRWEADMAEQFGKRIAPVVIKPLGNVSPPEVISKRNYLFLVDGGQSNTENILKALQTDIGWVREHTRLSELASSWVNARRPRSRLLQGSDIGAAEFWERSRTQTAPVVTPLLGEYIRRSRQWSNLRRYLYAVSIVLFAASIGIGTYVWHRQVPLKAIRAINDAGGSVQQVSDGLYVTLPSNAANIGALVRSMSALDSIVEVDLAGTGIDDANSSFLAQHKRLKRVDLGDNPIGDAGLRNFSALEGMEKLTLKGTRISDDGLGSLSHMSKLRNLDLTGTNITGKGLLELANLSQLKQLTLDGTSLQSRYLEYLPFAGSLETLSLSEARLTDDDVPKLARYKNLHELYLDSNPLRGHSLDKIANLRLSFLGLAATRIDSTGFKALEKLQSVDDVGLKDTKSDDEAFSSVCKMNLKVIRIPDTNVTDNGFFCASNFHNLTAIYIGATNLDMKAIRALSDLNNVQEFYFPATRINDDVIDILPSMKRLEKVWVYNSKMTLSGILRLKTMRPDLKVNTSGQID
jgi:Leucine-rich repeat (LRR) protein